LILKEREINSPKGISLKNVKKFKEWVNDTNWMCGYEGYDNDDDKDEDEDA